MTPIRLKDAKPDAYWLFAAPVKRGKAEVVAEGVPLTRTEVPLAAAEVVTRAEVVIVELE